MKIAIYCPVSNLQLFQITWLDNSNSPIKKNVETIVETMPDAKRKTTKSKLQMKMKRQLHNTSIRCEAQNSAESSPRIASMIIQVEFAPYVTVEKSSVVVREGESAMFRCITESNPVIVTYRWSVGGEEQGLNEERLVIPRVRRDDNGKIIKCCVSNSIGTSEDTIILDIHCKLFYL